MIRTLMKDGELEVMVETHPKLNDPILYLVQNGKLVRFTKNPGIHEFDYGEFVTTVQPTDDFGKRVMKAIEALSNPKSVIFKEKIWCLGENCTTFTLKQEYLDVLMKYIREDGW